MKITARDNSANPYAVPATDRPTDVSLTAPVWKLFSLRGTLDRTSWLMVITLNFLTFVAFLSALGKLTPTSDLAVFPVILAYCWIVLAAHVKRLHDRNKSGTWLLFGLIPFAGLWIIVELACLPGVTENNRFADPS